VVGDATDLEAIWLQNQEVLGEEKRGKQNSPDIRDALSS
jgi:hypothetical protein